MGREGQEGVPGMDGAPGKDGSKGMPVRQTEEIKNSISRTVKPFVFFNSYSYSVDDMYPGRARR